MQILNALQFPDGSKQKSATVAASGSGGWGSFRSLIALPGSHFRSYPSTVGSGQRAYVHNQFILFPLWMNIPISADLMTFVGQQGGGDNSYAEISLYNVHDSAGNITLNSVLGQIPLSTSGNIGVQFDAPKTIKAGWLGIRFLLPVSNRVVTNNVTSWGAEFPQYYAHYNSPGMGLTNVSAAPASVALSGALTGSAVLNDVPVIAFRVAST